MRITGQRLTIGLALAATLSAAACSSNGDTTTGNPVAPSAPPQSGPLTIDIAENNGANSFYPSPTTVAGGQVIVWRNSDRDTHDVVFDDGSGGTGRLAPNTLSQPITLPPGTYPYHCSIHPTMTGTLTVGAAASQPGASPNDPGY
jgi:plastocyanin